MSPDDRLARLIERARAELPEPGDPRKLMEDLAAADLAGPEALDVLRRTSLAWQQLRDLRLERIWQSGFGWFLARAAMITGFVLLLYSALGRPSAILVQGIVTGVIVYYLIVTALAPWRLRRHKARRAGILEAYAADLSSFLDDLRPS